MNEHPILFSAPMIRALRDGTKTQTRRIVNPKTAPWLLSPHGEPWSDDYVLDPGNGLVEKSPYGQPGDRLWVRETWAPWSDHIEERGEEEALADAKRQVPWACIVYRADANGGHVQVKRWRPSIFLPRWASRMSLAITSVRVERLQAISEEDAQAEGVSRIRIYEPEDNLGDEINGHGYAPPLASYVGSYEVLWDEINGKRALWASNPWVWVVEFKVGSCAS